ncbi:extracellular matrix regulator RemB [Tepidibacillus infernus]|uniref:DUF370 domain-containing protein n=1 Tax=Tepidibacillus decaturensis TaxID=1413211 RepID=A0A135L749_9BACI|nr:MULTISPECIES: extracellular matrix/biofilm biosynthesis regulator RemA family protein [Tepidibacillus]KXG44796.1 hypothetical protein U473_12765 [Tepidibacillus decaturensis]GBF11451.1 hypothetical protein HK1_01482 [Tepidibacillus sp. HK-1]
MFMHIGGDIVVKTKEIVAILDISHFAKRKKKLHSFIAQVENKNNVVKITTEGSKSLVVTADKMYYSPISSLTLLKRANTIF